MSIESAPKEENCFNVIWKIKNFSYGSEIINSPEFTLDGDMWRLDIRPKYVECRLVVLRQDYKFQWMQFQLSFLSCDGSSSLMSSGKCLQVSREILFGTRRSAFLPEDTLTVRFQYPTLSKRGNLFVESQIGVKYKCFLWTVKNFNKDQYHKNDTKMSAENSNRFGIIEMCLNTMDGINTDEQLYLEISRTNGEQCYFVLKVSVLDIDGKAVNCVSGEFLFIKQDSQEKWKFPPIIKKKVILSCKDLLLPNDTLSLKCDISISLGTVTDQTAVLTYFEDAAFLVQKFEDLSKCFKEKSSPDSVTDLQSDLRKILDNKVFSDVILQVSSEVIHAHKTILGARSPFFKSLFTYDTTENIVIDDLDADTLRRLLLYMYTDSISDYQESNIRKLYFAAHKYQVPSLKQKCSSFLMANLSLKSICEMLSLADLYKDADLERAVLEFISTYNSEVFASKEWKKLEENNSSLAFKALRKICSNKRFD